MVEIGHVSQDHFFVRGEHFGLDLHICKHLVYGRVCRSKFVILTDYPEILQHRKDGLIPGAGRGLFCFTQSFEGLHRGFHRIVHVLPQVVCTHGLEHVLIECRVELGHLANASVEAVMHIEQSDISSLGQVRDRCIQHLDGLYDRRHTRIRKHVAFPDIPCFVLHLACFTRIVFLLDLVFQAVFFGRVILADVDTASFKGRGQSWVQILQVLINCGVFFIG